ncbi:MAG: protein kinase [Proteobacteria bacterium]|nr:protein kinase [Pseudomonadota bacterium]MBU1499433.1 protein kinase [Patescibacteria group bacterium]
MSDRIPEKETTEAISELYDIKIKPLPPDTPAVHTFLWKRQNPTKGAVGFFNIDGEYHQYEYQLVAGQPRYKLLPGLSDKFPSHILPMIDTKLGRKVIAKSGTRSGGGVVDWHDPVDEAHKAGVTEHPNIATIHGIAADKNKEPYIVMEFLSNGTLDRWLEKDHRIEDIDNVVKGIASALEHIHTQKKLVYADMKPFNIGFDEEWRPKILDFELAVKMSDDGYTRGARGGTPAYEAPEQVHHDRPLSVRTDVYSLATTIFSIFTDKQDGWSIKSFRDDNFEKNPESLVPFRKAYEKKLSKVQKQQISKVLHRALSAEPNDRQVSIKEFYQEWHRALTAS